MQTIWTRASKSTSACKCFICKRSPPSLTRQTVTAPSRHRPGFDSVFAAFISTAILGATIADSISKDVRRQRWIKAIDKANKDLEDRRNQQNRRLAVLAPLAQQEHLQGEPEVQEERREYDIQKSSQEDFHDELQHSIRAGPWHIHQREPKQSMREESKQSTLEERKHFTWKQLFDWSRQELSLRRELGLEAWKGFPLSVLENAPRSMLDDFVQNHQTFLGKFQGQGRSEMVDRLMTRQFYIKKLKTLEWSIAGMTLSLMRSMAGAPFENDMPNNKKIKVAKDTEPLSLNFRARRRQEMEIIDHLQALRVPLMPRAGDDAAGYQEYHYNFYTKFPSPPYSLYSADPLYNPEDIRKLNQTLQSLFDSVPDTPQAIDSVLPDVCSTILFSSVPPNVHTYNVLLVGFAKAKRHDLLPCVIKSIQETHIRPNEVTNAQILTHYIHAENEQGFLEYGLAMQGLKEGPLHDPQIPLPNLVQSHYNGYVLLKDSDRIVHRRRYSEWQQMRRHERAHFELIKLKIKEAAQCNREVHHALIRGALFFKKSNMALQYFRTMVDEGWEPNQEILLCIMEFLVESRAWEQGLATWHQLQYLEGEPSRRSMSAMINLCWKCRQFGVLWNAFHVGVKHEVFPSTVLEISLESWIKILKDSEDEIYLTASVETILDVANQALALKHELKKLLNTANFTGRLSPQNLRDISVKAKELAQELSLPNIETEALFKAAEEIQSQSWQATKSLEISNKRMLALIEEARQLSFQVMMEKLEMRIDIATDTATTYIKEVGQTVLILALQKMKTTIKHLIKSMDRTIENLANRLLTLEVQFLVQTVERMSYDIESSFERYSSIVHSTLVYRHTSLRTDTEQLTSQVRQYLSDGALKSWERLGQSQRTSKVRRKQKSTDFELHQPAHRLHPQTATPERRDHSSQPQKPTLGQGDSSLALQKKTNKPDTIKVKYVVHSYDDVGKTKRARQERPPQDRHLTSKTGRLQENHSAQDRNLVRKFQVSFKEDDRNPYHKHKRIEQDFGPTREIWCGNRNEDRAPIRFPLTGYQNRLREVFFDSPAGSYPASVQMLQELDSGRYRLLARRASLPPTLPEHAPESAADETTDIQAGRRANPRLHNEETSIPPNTVGWKSIYAGA
ncbi:MAG: hypothetical protein Q9190_007167 [Brigantiaea leucoxantha]